jgi:AraC family transcriptional regulator
VAAASFPGEESLQDGLLKIFAQVETASGLSFQILKATGVLDVPGMEDVVVDLHLGAPAKMACRRDGKRFMGTSLRGHVGIIPARASCRWEMFDDNDLALVLNVPQKLIAAVASEFDADPARIEIRNRFQIRDSQLEMLSLAIKNELELGCPSGRLFLEGLGIAIASRLLTHHSSLTKHTRAPESLTDRRLKQVLSFIEENLSQDLSLEQIAAVANVSPSHLKAVFRKSMGVPVYQYVIQRRVELAKSLLLEENLSVAEVALAAGFAHQSHLARHMRRVLGAPPSVMKRILTETAAKL